MVTEAQGVHEYLLVSMHVSKVSGTQYSQEARPFTLSNMRFDLSKLYHGRFARKKKLIFQFLLLSFSEDIILSSKLDKNFRSVYSGEILRGYSKNRALFKGRYKVFNTGRTRELLSQLARIRRPS